MKSLSDREKEETLSAERLCHLAAGYTAEYYPDDNRARPEGSLVQIMQWAARYVTAIMGSGLRSGEDSEWIPFIHNKISIDGSFIKFCEESNIDVKAVHTDAITSWQTDQGAEHFVGVGIFKITKGDLVFFHCALFHKGNQNEDEVSFFILVREKDFEKYLACRNAFEDWQKVRERDNQEIEVIGGSPILYDSDISWDDLFLPEDLKAQLRQTVEGFLNSKPTYEKLKVPWRRGVGIWGAPGSGKTTALRILIAQYPVLKPITIQAGHSSPDELLEEAFEYAEDHAPALLFFEDLQELVKTIDMRGFLQLLDGFQKRDGILTIVTGNDFSDLEANLKSRPRRFDRFFEFPLPNLELCKKYLTKYFGVILTPKKIESIAKKAVKKKLSYAHLQEVYFNAVFIAIPEGRETPNANDVDLSLQQVIQEKALAESDFLTKKRDLTDDEDIDEEEGDCL